MDTRLVLRRRLTVARIGLAGLLVPLVLGIAAGLMLPRSLVADGADRPVFALFFGVALCVSAIPVAAKILIDMNLLHRDVGQLTLAAAVVEDAVGWLMLSVVSAMATTGVRSGDVAISVLTMLGTVVIAAVFGRPVARAALRFSEGPRDAGGQVAVVTVLIIAVAAVAHALTLEAVFGAFVAGAVIGSCGSFDPHRVAPLRMVVLTVLAPIFFATAGLRVDLTKLTDLSVLAAGLNARGVIELVIAAIGVRLGVLNTASYTVIVLVAIVTTIMTPPVLRVIMQRVEQASEENLRHPGGP